MSALFDEYVAIRREFHSLPELGFSEHKTRRRIAEVLTGLGLDVLEGTGVIGVLRAGTGEQMIGLRADMDALPIKETSQHEYPSSVVGVMHACGHDGHMAMLLAAAAELAQRPTFDGTVVFIFQPNEELGLGAKAMIDEGILRQFAMDEIYAIHNLPGAPVGHVSTRKGLICASESIFEIRIEGQGGHASLPHMGRDAISIGAEIVQALQSIVSRKLTPGSGAVVSVTEFVTDGQRNVMAGTAVLKGDVRARTPADRDAIERFIRNIAAGTALSHDVTTAVDFKTEFIETRNADVPTEAVIRAARSIGLEAIGDRAPMSFSEDFAHFLEAVPGCFLLLGNGETGTHGQPLHSSSYDFNDALVPIGAAFWAALVRDRLPTGR
ncbi:MAG: amidohydrolase [Roseobacter sp.]